MRPAGIRPRLGFGPLEIIILLAVVSVVAVLTLPVITQANRLARVQETARILGDLSVAAYNGAATEPPDFRTDMGKQVSSIAYLLAIVKNTDVNPCGAKYNSGNWKGPYIRFAYDSTVGLVTPIGVGSDNITRIQQSAIWNLQITFPSVDLADVQLLDAVIDASNGSTSGLVQWSTTGGVTTFKYTFPVDNTC